MKFDSTNLINENSSTGTENKSDIDQVMVDKLNISTRESRLVAFFSLITLRNILETYTKQNPIPDFDLRLLKAYFDKDENTNYMDKLE